MKFVKSLVLLVLLSWQNLFFAQSATAVPTPWNLKMWYGKQQYSNNLDLDYRCIGLGVDYSICRWMSAGIFVNGGTCKYGLGVYGNNGVLLFDGNCRDIFLKYGINAQFHPLSIFFPNLIRFDVYLNGCIGAFSYSSDYWPKENKFLYGMGIGLALYPLRHVGIYYERDYDNVNTEFQNNKRSKGMNRFGLNIRFGSPKKRVKNK